ncbi:P-loop containing nucleoside triphosphate hydrolase protein [Fistulina hepatica ATCC 64428]|nr:P-loop containing nucleoside triphosphate hydrolase protein [Fistulina hepatica ATCC 64428]
MKRSRSSDEPPKKRLRNTGKQKVTASTNDVASSQWPPYFSEALNTVLAFVSSRKHLATSFSVVRTSVEGLLKRPLELQSVAELKALLPNLIKFAYIPRNEMLIHGARAKSPDFSLTPSQSQQALFEEERVLILDFHDNSKGKTASGSGNINMLSLPPSMTPAAVKKLIEARNNRFKEAVDELIQATPAGDDPVTLLQNAGRAQLPVHPHASSGHIPPIIPHEVPDTDSRASVKEILSALQAEAWYDDQIVDRRTFEKRPAQYGVPDPPLPELIVQALNECRGIESLYSHQVASINAISQNKNVVVSTSTASGKSVIYQVPLLRNLLEDSNTRAIFVYPTKALAQDQKIALQALLCACKGLEHIKVATYDGDTSQEDRTIVREVASVIFTNFDTLHASILPREEIWRQFLRDVRLFAVDELHYYSGLMGSHVAQIMRRFRRVCAALGNTNISFISCSATISNPQAHMQNIFGLEPSDIVVVTEDGAPSVEKEFLIWNPPLVDEGMPNAGRRSPISQASVFMRYLMKRGIRVILFCKYRKACELAMKALRNDLSNEGRYDILERVKSYRGGYSQEDRRQIERDAFTGRLLGIIATNALELGVDIGSLDAVLMLGFPLSIASFRQQAGRAGRRSRDSLVALVADGSPIDQHFLNNPDELFGGHVDDLVVDLHNPVILEAHLQCASYEMPLALSDHVYFGPLMKEICESRLVKDEEGWFHPHPKFLPYPSRHISIRGVQEEKYAVVDMTHKGHQSIIEEVEVTRAMFELYEGGVFIHQGLVFVVDEVNHDMQIAKVTRMDVNWITSPRNVDPVQTTRIKEIKGSSQYAYYGRVDVSVNVFGFFKIRGGVILDVVDVYTPPWECETTGMWIDLSNELLQLLRDRNIDPAEAIHSAQHAFMNRFPLAQDVKTECKAPEKEYMLKDSERKRPARLVFYDCVGRGGGVVAKAFDTTYPILEKAEKAIEECPCDEGCVQNAGCTEHNAVCSKIGALVIIKNLLGRPQHPESIPYETKEKRGSDTIVSAQHVRAVEGVVVEPAL